MAGLIGLSFPPLLIVAGGGALATFFFTKRAQKEELQRAQRELMRWLARVVEDAAHEMSAQLREALLGAPQKVEAFFSERLESRRGELEALIAECKQRVRIQETERARLRADAEGRLAQMGDVHRRASELFREISDPASVPAGDSQSLSPTTSEGVG
jgi:hypothetical protein